MLTGQTLTPVNVFILIAFINVLSAVLCLDLAYDFLGTYDAYASLGRLEEFLVLENLSLICHDHAADDRIDTDRNYSNSNQNSLVDRHGEMQGVFVPDYDKMNELHKPTILLVMNLTHKKEENLFYKMSNSPLSQKL